MVGVLTFRLRRLGVLECGFGSWGVGAEVSDRNRLECWGCKFKGLGVWNNFGLLQPCFA